jgi:hypothetical protein
MSSKNETLEVLPKAPRLRPQKKPLEPIPALLLPPSLLQLSSPEPLKPITYNSTTQDDLSTVDDSGSERLSNLSIKCLIEEENPIPFIPYDKLFLSENTCPENYNSYQDTEMQQNESNAQQLNPRASTQENYRQFFLSGKYTLQEELEMPETRQINNTSSWIFN